MIISVANPIYDSVFKFLMEDERYVKHNAYDYDGEEVKEAMNDPFIGSLIHDSIIVQIPLLHGQINNHLDKVLSVFDQS